MKSVIVTGAGTGLGRELALQYSKAGYHLILIGRTKETLLEVKREIREAEIAILDIRNKLEVDEQILEIFRNFDVIGLINNAGVGYFGPFEKMTATEAERMIQTNVLGTMYMTQAILPTISNKTGSFVMNIISTAGLRGKVNESVYVASKFAVRGFTESLQKEYEGKPVHITAVYMGGMNTPFWNHSQHVMDPSRFRSPKEVAELIYSEKEKECIIIESK